MTLSVDEAYAVQQMVASLRVERGEVIAGYKVGCTSPVIRARLNVEHPVFGYSFEHEWHESSVTLAQNDYCQLAIEGELAVELAADLTPSPSTAEIEAAVGAVFPVIELHNLVFRGVGPTAMELIASNAIHAGCVAGDRSGFVTGLGDIRRLAVSIDDKVVAEVEGDVLKQTIIASMTWLPGELAKHQVKLKSGMRVLCGSVPDLFSISGGQDVRVETDVTESVTMRVS